MTSIKQYESPLLYCKSKVAIHPSGNKKDNIFGFLVCYTSETMSHNKYNTSSSSSSSNNHEFNIAWIREDNISISLKNQLEEADLHFAETSGETQTSFYDNNSSSGSAGSKKNLPNVDARMLEYKSDWYTNINSIFSIQFRLPSQWYKGSIIINCKQHDYTSEIPVLFFHDEMCESTKKISKQKLQNSFDPFTNDRNLYWGGDDFKSFLFKNCDLQKTNTLNSNENGAKTTDNIFLINASLDDLRNFQSNPSGLNNKRFPSLANSTVKGDSPKDKKKGLYDTWETKKWSVLGKIADITNKYTTDDPKINPILQTLYSSETINKIASDKYVKKLLQKSQPQINKISTDFEGAKVYLAKWALNVKEQVEKQDNIYKTLTLEMDNMVTEEEVHVALERNHPLSLLKWESMFDEQGRLKYTVTEIKDYIFHGGCVDDDVRKKVWPFLLNVFPWDSSEDERVQMYETLKTIYEMNYKNQWILDQVPDEFDPKQWEEEVFKIKKDVFRNDRHLDLYKHNTDDGEVPKKSDGSEISAEEEQEEEFEDSWAVKNPHLKILQNILLSYGVFNPKLGYCQGMTDLLSPIYFILQDEVLSFWCFIEFMNRMERNFSLDQSGIKEQMVTLGELTSLMLPDLMTHLTKCDSSNLFFVYKMILILFKRDFEEEKVKQIWEIIFTNYYSSQFHLFFILAILQKNSVAIQQLNEFDDILKYFNDLKNMDNVELMTRAELLFIKFKKIVTNCDELKMLSQPVSVKQADISSNLRGLLSKEVILVKS